MNSQTSKSPEPSKTALKSPQEIKKRLHGDIHDSLITTANEADIDAEIQRRVEFLSKQHKLVQEPFIKLRDKRNKLRDGPLAQALADREATLSAYWTTARKKGAVYYGLGKSREDGQKKSRTIIAIAKAKPFSARAILAMLCI